MKIVKIDKQLSVSQLCLGGGKMVDMPIDDGIALLDKAQELGINIVDAHHRYGNCETIVAHSKIPHRMTKVSAYCNADKVVKNISNSCGLLQDIDILWVSDLDNDHLYQKGEIIFNKYFDDFPRLGITSESPELARKFISTHPECELLMIPVFIGQTEMAKVCKNMRKIGVKTFVIKPFDDGRLLQDYTVGDCLRWIKTYADPDVVIFGTKNIDHLEQVTKIWDKL